jgi:heme exporter protein D
MPDLDMSPYAGFVWSAYGITALVLGGLAASIWVRARRVAARLDTLEEVA